MAQTTSPTPTLTLDAEDHAALLGVVHDVCASTIAKLVETPETRAEFRLIGQAMNQFVDLGLISGETTSGLGLWDAPQESEAAKLSLSILREIARTSPSIAYALHIRAIGTWLDRSASVVPGSTTVSFDNTAQQSGRDFGQAFSTTPLTPQQEESLAAAWSLSGEQAEHIVVDGEKWEHSWQTTWSADYGWQFVRISHSELELTPESHFHGFDELQVHLTKPLSAGEQRSRLDADAVIDAHAVHGMGLLAIATGAAERALAAAHDYAAIRTQGGQFISEYDAVGQLLESGHQAIAQADATLTLLSQRSGGIERLVSVWRARAQLHPALTASGSNSLQVFGGIGYMRDLGMEKTARDLNTLRRLGGSPHELVLRCAAFHPQARRTA